MEILIMHPKNKEQLSALKAFAKALKVDFETAETPCSLDHTPNSETIKAIEEARKGKTKKITDIDAFFKLFNVSPQVMWYRLLLPAKP